MSENSSNDLGAFLAGFVIGGLVGAATAIILAPQSGQETRAQIATKSSDLIHAGEEQYHQYLDAAGEMVSQTREQVGTTGQRVQQQARIVLDRGKSEAASDNGGDSQEEPADSSDAAAE